MRRALETLVKGYGKIGDMLYYPQETYNPIVSRQRNGNIEFTKLVNPDLQTFRLYTNTGSPPDYLPTLQVPGPTALNNQPPETC